MPTASKSTDAIAMLKTDHRNVKALFRQFEKMHKDGGSTEEKRRLSQQIIQELSMHAFIEEEVFYPMARDRFEDLNDLVLESYEEHHIVKNTCGELMSMDLSDERYDAKMSVLMELVKHHIEEEESEMFPQIRDALGRKTLQDIGARMTAMKKKAPPPQPTSVEQPTLAAKDPGRVKEEVAARR